MKIKYVITSIIKGQVDVIYMLGEPIIRKFVPKHKLYGLVYGDQHVENDK